MTDLPLTFLFDNEGDACPCGVCQPVARPMGVPAYSPTSDHQPVRLAGTL